MMAPVDDSRYLTHEEPTRQGETDLSPDGIEDAVRQIAGDRPPDCEAMQALLASVVESSDDAIISEDLDGRILSWNAGAKRMYGYTAAEAQGRHLSFLLPPDHPDEAGAILDRVRRGHVVRHFETLCMRKDGQLVDVSLTVSPIHDRQGRIFCASTVARDITATKRTEEALRRAHRAQSALIAVQEAIVGADDEDTVLASVCDILVRVGGYRMAWAGWAEDDPERRVRPVAHAGYEAGYIQTLALTWADTERGRGPVGTAVRTGQPVIIRDLAADPLFAPWRAEALVRGYGSVIALPISIAAARGVIAAYSSDRDAFDDEEVGLLARLAADVGYGIDALRARRERERSREALVKLSMAVEQAADAIAITNREGVIEYVNPAFVQATGYTAAEAIGQTPRILKSGVHPPEVYAELWRTALAGRKWRGVLVNRRKDGSLRHEDKVVVPLRDAEGQITHFVATGRDITEQVRAREAQARLAAVIEALPYLVATADTRGRLRTLNPAGRALLGVDERLPISDIRIGDLYAEESREGMVKEAMPSAIREGLWSGDGTMRTAQGKDIPVGQLLLAHRSDGGSVEFVSLIASDLSEQRRLEDELRQAQKMEAVGRLAGGVAHDFNNLLTPILTYSGFLLMRMESSDPLRRYAEQIAKTAERAAALPRQLLAFSRRQTLQPKVIDLNALVQEMEKMLRRLIGEDIELTFVPPSEPARVKADPGQVEQVLMNLVVNARDAMPRGGNLTIAVGTTRLGSACTRLHPGIAPGEYALLSVTDTGCGMDRETQSRIFEPFFTTKEEGKGTGLGLSTVYGIVKQSGGHIGVRSEVGRGSTFEVCLPRVDEVPEGTSSAERPTTLVQGEETILLVDDDEGVRTSIREFLAMAGYTVLQARNGTEALDALQRHPGPVHLLLTDVVMPDLNGRDLARRVASLSAGTKIVFMSGYTDDAIAQYGILQPGTAFVQKPFSPRQLMRKLREVLDGRGSPPGIASDQPPSHAPRD